MSIAKRIIAVFGIAGVLVACAVAGVQVAFADQQATGARSSESVDRKLKAVAEDESAPAPNVVHPPAAVSSAGAEDGIPHYDASSDISLIEYPTSFDSVELTAARESVEVQAATAGCMRDKGFDYEFVLWWDRPISQNGEGLPSSDEKYGSPEFEALYGDPYASDDDVSSGAGCRGQVLARRDG
ncbi:hypothetical protein [Rathayibacter sp. PhB127]|uniref:hypothetical protein n=1 Tax=Rathayibacter sp. PhB127 TaxID=2485176 RepID=UPI0011CDABFD|nr:hypothetical protein [Rathayibacter sp. PhB127]